MKKLSIINENIFDGIGRRSKGGVKRKEDEVEKVDLGLPSGTIWAACNLGASSKEEYGNYYSWGEIEPKDYYNCENYKFVIRGNLTKYNEEDGKTILDPEDDAAHVVLGGKWHIPTREQIKELLDNTTNEDIKLNGVKGRLFKSEINGNTIFFPHSGSNNSGSRSSYISGEGMWSYYWSSSLFNKESTNYAMTLCCDVFENKFKSGYRCYGYSVRGVWNKEYML